MSAAKGQKFEKRVQKFEPQTKEGAREAKKFLVQMGKDGGWESWDEFLSLYVIPCAANRLCALQRYQDKQDKKTHAKTPKKIGAKKTAHALPKARTVKVKALTQAEAVNLIEAKDSPKLLGPAE